MQRTDLPPTMYTELPPFGAVARLNLRQQELKRPASGGLSLFSEVPRPDGLSPLAQAPAFVMDCTFYARAQPAVARVVRGASSRNKHDAKEAAAYAALRWLALNGEPDALPPSTKSSPLASPKQPPPTVAPRFVLQVAGAERTAAAAAAAVPSLARHDSPPTLQPSWPLTAGKAKSAGKMASWHRLMDMHSRAVCDDLFWQSWTQPHITVTHWPRGSDKHFCVTITYCVHSGETGGPVQQLATGAHTSLKGAIAAAADAAAEMADGGAPRPLALDNETPLTFGQVRHMLANGQIKVCGASAEPDAPRSAPLRI